MNRGPALVSIPTHELRRLLSLVFRGEATCPLDIVELSRHGFQDRADVLLDVVRGLDLVGVRAVLVAVLAERAPR